MESSSPTSKSNLQALEKAATPEEGRASWAHTQIAPLPLQKHGLEAQYASARGEEITMQTTPSSRAPAASPAPWSPSSGLSRGPPEAQDLRHRLLHSRARMPAIAAHVVRREHKWALYEGALLECDVMVEQLTINCEKTTRA